MVFSHVTGWPSWSIIASIRSELHCNNQVTNLNLSEHLVNTPQLAVLMIKVCWGNWNVSLHAGTFHMTCTVICYEITLKKCTCVSRSILSTVPPSNKNKWFPVSMNIWVELWWQLTFFLLGCIGSDDCKVYLLAFKLSTLY